MGLPQAFTELGGTKLTGPGVGISSAFRSFLGLCGRSWEMIGYALAAERRGGDAARFARANIALYIESVYDSNFGLAQIGEKLAKGYQQLGGAKTMGETLPASRGGTAREHLLRTELPSASPRRGPAGLVNAFVAAGAGFLLAVLWMDLMFDVQAIGALRGRTGAELPEQALASIAAYYARVTTSARPMNRLIALAMLATLAAIVVEAADGYHPGWLPWVSLALALTAIGLAGARTVPGAVRLGTRRDTPSAQSALATRILTEHLICLAAIGCLIGVQLGWG